jgi:ABC-2 type transport system ATP-binding protein
MSAPAGARALAAAGSPVAPAIEASHLGKSFTDRVAVDDLSFSVSPGEIFGLIGPNGAGKTTTIRMAMGVIAPDAGEVKVFGRKASRENRRLVGYLPEERGLYRKMTVIDCITYIASLIGVDAVIAEKRADELLRLTDLLSHKRETIETLSKGMGQIVQFIISVIHDPAIAILDEPFSGLDPVNKDLLIGILVEQKRRGKTIVLSTHLMSDVEELCDRILMIDRGRAVLYGSLREVRSRYGGNTVLVGVDGELGEISGVAARHARGDKTELVLEDGVTPRQVLAEVIRGGSNVTYFEATAKSLHEIFLHEARHE